MNTQLDGIPFTAAIQIAPIDAERLFRTACVDTAAGLINAGTALIGWPLLLVGGAVLFAGLVRFFDRGGFAAVAAGQSSGQHSETRCISTGKKR